MEVQLKEDINKKNTKKGMAIFFINNGLVQNYNYFS